MAGPVGAICCSASSLLAFRLLSSRTSKPTSPPLACYYVPEVRNLYGGTGYLPKIGSSYSHFTISSVANEINYTEQVDAEVKFHWPSASYNLFNMANPIVCVVSLLHFCCCCFACAFGFTLTLLLELKTLEICFNLLGILDN
ncbi:hypothetical protein V2J09_013149 [Rumex salicifolius]